MEIWSHDREGRRAPGAAQGPSSARYHHRENPFDPGDPRASPERPAAARFSSPPGPPPPEEPYRLQDCIKAANDLLRTLGAPRPGEPRFLRFPLQHLAGQQVEATVLCGQRSRVLAGKVGMAGRDFLELQDKRGIFLIPYRQLCSIRWQADRKRSAAHERRRPPLDLDPSLRRRLILRFGEVVAEDQGLLQLFFGVPLRLKLKDFLGRSVMVYASPTDAGTSDTGTLLYGVLQAVEEALQLRAGERVDQVRFEAICFIRI